MPAAMLVDELPPIDVVLLSHNHYDHLDSTAARRITADAKWVVPRGLGALLRRWKIREIVELDWWESTTIAGLSLTAIPARHFSGRGITDRNRSLWCGYAVSVNGWKALFGGDTAYHDGYSEVGAKLGPFDFVMMPIGAYAPRWFMHVVHVDPDEAVKMFRDLASAHPDAPLPLMLGIHWGTFRLTNERMDEPPDRARAAWHASKLDPRQLWIARFGESRSVG